MRRALGLDFAKPLPRRIVPSRRSLLWFQMWRVWQTQNRMTTAINQPPRDENHCQSFRRRKPHTFARSEIRRAVVLRCGRVPRFRERRGHCGLARSERRNYPLQKLQHRRLVVRSSQLFKLEHATFHKLRIEALGGPYPEYAVDGRWFCTLAFADQFFE